METKESKNKRGGVAQKPDMKNQNSEEEILVAEAPSGAKKLPADIFSDKIPDKNDMPLDGEVKKKDYANIPDSGSSPPTNEKGEFSGSPGETAPPGPPPDSEKGTAPAPEPVKTAEEISSQAGQTVELLLKAYDRLHGLGRWAGRVDKNDLLQLHVTRQIDLNQQLPLGKRSIAVREFFEEFNNGIDENITVTDEFKNNIREPLKRICIKRGWLLSDELYVGMVVAEDLTTKISMLIGLKKSANLVIAACKEIVNQSNQSAQQQQQQPADEGISDVDDENWKEPDAPPAPSPPPPPAG